MTFIDCCRINDVPGWAGCAEVGDVSCELFVTKRQSSSIFEPIAGQAQVALAFLQFDSGRKRRPPLPDTSSIIPR